MAADLTQNNTVFNFTGSEGSLEITSISIRFGANVVDIGEDSGGGGGSTRPSSGFLYPRRTD